MSYDEAQGINNYLQYTIDQISPDDTDMRFNNIDELYTYFCTDKTYNNTDIYRILCAKRSDVDNSEVGRYNGTQYDKYEAAEPAFFAPRTCNQFWNPTVTIGTTNVDSFYLGMASQRAEREDFIITPDLRGRVFGALDFTRRDLMAQNLQRGRDHGLPDYNSARRAYGLDPVYSFEDLNEIYGTDADTTANIERLRDVYNNDMSK